MAESDESADADEAAADEDQEREQDANQYGGGEQDIDATEQTERMTDDDSDEGENGHEDENE